MTTANCYLSSGPTPPDQVSSPNSGPCSEGINKTSVTISGVESPDSPHLTITVVQKQLENTVSKVEEEEVQMPCKIDIELECAVPGCNFDGQGTKFKTPPLSQHEALQLLKIHRAIDHGLRGAEIIYDCDAQVEALPEPVCQAVLHRGCSEEEFKSFTVDWDKFAEKYSSWFTAQPGEEDEYMLNDLLNSHLLGCIPASMETAIRKDRSNTVDKVPTADILMDIKMFIVREGVGFSFLLMGSFPMTNFQSSSL